MILRKMSLIGLSGGYISEQLKVSAPEVIEMNRRLRGAASLNVLISDEDTTQEWQDRLVDPSPDPESLLTDADDYRRRQAALAEALKVLSARERAILEARMLADEPRTLDELARQYRVSRERVRQIEQRAFERVKGAVRAKVADFSCAKPKQSPEEAKTNSTGQKALENWCHRPRSFAGWIFPANAANLPGGGVALLRATTALAKLKPTNDDQRHGVDTVKRALGWPARQIAENAGEDALLIVGKILESKEYAWGFDAQTGEYGNLFAKGIIDPTKVVRSALQDAASIAALLITTEAMVAEAPKKKKNGGGERAPTGAGELDL